MSATDPVLLALAFLAGAAAGFVDSIAGGGGLLALPVLLAVLPGPAQAIATLKAQGLFGTLAATARFARQGLIRPRTAAFGAAAALAGGAAGGAAAQTIDSGILMALVPVLLAAVALYVAFSPRAADVDSRERLSPLWFGATAVPAIGIYAGFFGPGTGAFFTVALVALRGHGLLEATADAKLLDCATGIGAVLLFLAGGQIAWPVALAMGAGQALGAYAGAAFAIRRGTALVRPVLIAVSLATTCKLALDDPEGWAWRLVRLGLQVFAA